MKEWQEVLRVALNEVISVSTFNFVHFKISSSFKITEMH